MNKKENNSKKTNKLTKILFIFFIIIFVCGISYLTYYLYDRNRNNKDNKEIFNDIEIDESKITESKTERMLQLEELQKENEEIVGWLEIEGTNINYPVLQASDNDYYLTHNYKKEKTSGGSLFLDKSYDFSIPSSNLLIYGHRHETGIMFEDLIKYKDEKFYKEHPNIRFTTCDEDSTYEIIAAFFSRVYYKSEKNVFRYYFFVNADNVKDFDSYVENVKKASIYDTGKTAKYGDQLMTLSTCSYHTEDGRFAVVAKKVK